MDGIRDINWKTPELEVRLTVGADEVVRLRNIVPTGSPAEIPASKYFKDSSLPLTEIRLNGQGTVKEKSSKTLIGSYVSSRLRYKSHRELRKDNCTILEIVSVDDISRISVAVHLTVYSGVPVLRSQTKLTNYSSETEITVSQCTSLVVGGMTTSVQNWWEDYVLSTATNSWFREAQWRDQSLPSIGIDDFGVYELPDGHEATLASYSLSNRGSFSTGTYLPMGMLKRKDQCETWLWQVENNGSWRWEIGDFKDSIYLAAGGPVGMDHDWRITLSPGMSFESVPVAVTHLFDTPDKAFSAMTLYRRAIRRKHADNEQMSLIFNDYMNCLMGDPTEEKITALIEPVVKSGAEYFVIDAGWYADDSGWWDDVGLWEPSKLRFPSGFKTLLDKIRSRGLIPGVWLEPEVIGVRSIAGKELPEAAFFQDHGSRVVERGRYQMDFRHPAVTQRMNKVVDNLVQNYGVGYFKFDYNIEVVQGTDVDGPKKGTGAAALEHNRAYLNWVHGLYDRYPNLVIESCSSGAQRMDYAMLAVHSLQSTSDQQDPVRYAAIAAAAPTAVTPEQSATWAYPQKDWSDEINALTVTNSLLGRVHLSGRLDQMSESQLEIVYSGMAVYKMIRQDLKDALPYWPLGLPAWHDDWIALAMSTPNVHYLSVWRRGGSESCNLPLAHFKGKDNIGLDVLYPPKLRFPTTAVWETDIGILSITVPNKICARLFRIQNF